VIESGVEDGLVAQVGGFDFDSGEIGVPRFVRGAADFFEVPVGDLGADVLAGSIFADTLRFQSLPR
jgi:hypothetical protein